MERHSGKRDAIIRNLQLRYDHPTADMIYNDLRVEYPEISMGTIYRNLAQLCEKGIVTKIGASGKERYDGHIEPHNHFFCDYCGEVYDIPLTLCNDTIQTAVEFVGAKVTFSEIVLHGVCKKCL